MGAAVQQGLWAVLFVSLFLYQLKEGRRREDIATERESKLASFITEISKQFEILAKQYERMSEDIREIKCDISKRE